MFNGNSMLQQTRLNQIQPAVFEAEILKKAIPFGLPPLIFFFNLSFFFETPYGIRRACASYV